MRLRQITQFDKLGDIPKNGVVRCRISDNVLDDECFPIADLKLQDGKVISIEKVYDASDAGGHDFDTLAKLKTRKQIFEFVKATGCDSSSFPCSYYEAFVLENK